MTPSAETLEEGDRLNSRAFSRALATDASRRFLVQPESRRALRGAREWAITQGVRLCCSAGMMGCDGGEHGPTSGMFPLYVPCQSWEQSCWKALVPPPHHRLSSEEGERRRRGAGPLSTQHPSPPRGWSTFPFSERGPVLAGEMQP